MDNIDLNNITLLQLFGLLAITAAVDVGTAIALALIRGQFSGGVIAVWLQSHVLLRVFPIFALAVIGHGIPAFDIPAIGPAFALALAGLTAYIVETIASLQDSFKDSTPPTDTTPVN